VLRDDLVAPSDIRSGKKTSGALMSTRTVWSSTTTTSVTSAKPERAFEPSAGSMMRSNVNLTSRAVNGTPSCHLTSWRRWNVHEVMSSLASQRSASRGSSSLVYGLTTVSGLNIVQ
jgi:hypothetical protein